MVVLITGGAGFIGANLVRRLLNENFEIKVLDNLSTGYKKNLEKLDINFINGDIRDKKLVEEITKKVDIIFHLAASVGYLRSLRNPQEDSEINVIGTINLLEAARLNSVEKIVYSSSAGIFGDVSDILISEDHPQNPNSPYGVSKLAAEKQIMCFGKLYGVISVCLRYFNVFGLYQRYDEYGNVIPIFANRLFADKPLIIYGDGKQTRDFINASDIAEVNYLAATKVKNSDVFNVGRGIGIPIIEIAKNMRNIVNNKSDIIFEPPRFGEVRHCTANIHRVKEKLGFSPKKSIEKDLEEYLYWFEKNEIGKKV